MKKTDTSIITDPIERFSSLITQGMESWVKAGQLLNEIIEEDPSARHRIIDRNPWITHDVLYTFERIGRRELYPKLMLDASPGARKLVCLPYGEQEKYFDAEIDVAVLHGDAIVIERKRLQHLKPHEAARVFSGSGLRPMPDQKKMLEDRIINGHEHQNGASNPGKTTPAESLLMPDNAQECLEQARALLLMAGRVLTANGKSNELLQHYLSASLRPIEKLDAMLKAQ